MIDSSDNVYIAGVFSIDLMVRSDAFIQYRVEKYNSSGMPQWSNSRSEGVLPVVTVDSAGNVYCAFEAFPAGVGFFEFRKGNLVKFNSSGVFQWEITVFDNPQVNFSFTADRDYIFSIDVDSSDNVYVAGSGHAEGYSIAKFDSSGDLQASFDPGLNNSAGTQAEVRGLSIDSNDNVIAVGQRVGAKTLWKLNTSLVEQDSFDHNKDLWDVDTDGTNTWITGERLTEFS